MIWRADVSRDITLMPIGDRWYRIPGHFSIDIWGPFPGRKHIDVDDGFEFDGRSGPILVDYLTPNLGSQPILKCWLTHDINAYDKSGLSFSETNALLRDMLQKAGYGHMRRNLIWAAVSANDSWFGEPLKGDREYPNLDKIHLRHFDR